MTDHTPGPWLYRPHPHDDWGWIRALPRDDEEIGALVACARAGWCPAELDLDEHRRNKTGPYEANARLIAAAPDMLAALKAVNKLISEAAMTGFDCKDGDWAERLFTSQQATSAAIAKTALALLDGQWEGLTKTVIVQALRGDTTALRLCIDRLALVRRGLSYPFRTFPSSKPRLTSREPMRRSSPPSSRAS